MDALDCRSPRTCPSCEHSQRDGSCALEMQLALAIAPARHERPRIAVSAATLPRALAA